MASELVNKETLGIDENRLENRRLKGDFSLHNAAKWGTILFFFLKSIYAQSQIFFLKVLKSFAKIKLNESQLLQGPKLPLPRHTSLPR